MVVPGVAVARIPHRFTLAAAILALASSVAECAPLTVEELRSLLGGDNAPSATLPAVATLLTVGALALRGTLEGLRTAPSGQPDWADIPEDTILDLRVSEIIYWYDTWLHLPAPESGAIVSFRTNTDNIERYFERRPSGGTGPLAIGQDYWVMAVSPSMDKGGELGLSGLYPIEKDELIIDYLSLERGDGGVVAKQRGVVRLPLAEYRACLTPPPQMRHAEQLAAERECILMALWEARQ